jgi:hypothetical protein
MMLFRPVMTSANIVSAPCDAPPGGSRFSSSTPCHVSRNGFNDTRRGYPGKPDIPERGIFMAELPFHFSRLKGHVDNELPLYFEYDRERPMAGLGFMPVPGRPVPEEDWPDRLRLIWDYDVRETISAWGIGKADAAIVISDDLEERLKRLNLGRHEMRRLPVCGETRKPLGFDITVLATLQAIPTIVARRDDGFSVNSWSTALTNHIWDDPYTPPPPGSALTCRNVKTDLDLWVDPIWSPSLFMSDRFVDAMKDVGQVEMLFLHPCREATNDDVVTDISAPLR